MWKPYMLKSSCRKISQSRLLLVAHATRQRPFCRALWEMSNIRTFHTYLCSLVKIDYLFLALLSMGRRHLGPFSFGPKTTKIINYRCGLLHKWIETEAMAKITIERVRHFYWRNIVFCFGLPRVIISDNGIQFASIVIVKFCSNLGIHNIFTSVEHPQTNKQAEAANKVIHTRMRKKLDEAKGLWVEQLHGVIWLFHTTLHSANKETPFGMVNGSDAMLSVEINTPTWWKDHYDEEDNQVIRQADADLDDDVR